MKKVNSSVDFDLKAIEIAKELSIAKLGTSSATSSNTAVGKGIGDMFLAIHEEVKKAFEDLEKED